MVPRTWGFTAHIRRTWGEGHQCRRRMLRIGGRNSALGRGELWAGAAHSEVALRVRGGVIIM